MKLSAWAAIAAICVFGQAVVAHDFKIGDLVINHPMAFETPKTAMTGGGYLSITNNGTQTDRLIEVQADFARVMLHTTEMKDDIARMLIRKMKPLEDLSEELTRHLKASDEEMIQFKTHLQQQRLRYEQLQNRTTEYLHRTQMQQWEKDGIDPVCDDGYGARADQEIELELLKRKDELGLAT